MGTLSGLAIARDLLSGFTIALIIHSLEGFLSHSLSTRLRDLLWELYRVPYSVT